MNDSNKRLDGMIAEGLVKTLEILLEERGLPAHVVPLQAEQAELEDLLAERRHKKKRRKK